MHTLFKTTRPGGCHKTQLLLEQLTDEQLQVQKRSTYTEVYFLLGMMVLLALMAVASGQYFMLLISASLIALTEDPVQRRKKIDRILNSRRQP